MPKVPSLQVPTSQNSEPLLGFWRPPRMTTLDPAQGENNVARSDCSIVPRYAHRRGESTGVGAASVVWEGRGSGAIAVFTPGEGEGS